MILAALLVLARVAHAEGNYQLTRNGKTFVWNEHPKAGDEATWSGRRGRDGYARGFGTLSWYTKQPGAARPRLYARYWGNMVRGKFNGPVNVHSKKKTHHAIFANGARVTRWARGRARSRMSAKQMALLAKYNAREEPEAPAAGPGEQSSEDQQSEEKISIQDLWSERWPKIDIDESLRVLALPPRRLRK